MVAFWLELDWALGDCGRSGKDPWGAGCQLASNKPSILASCSFSPVYLHKGTASHRSHPLCQFQSLEVSLTASQSAVSGTSSLLLVAQPAAKQSTTQALASLQQGASTLQFSFQTESCCSHASHLTGYHMDEPQQSSSSKADLQIW